MAAEAAHRPVQIYTDERVMYLIRVCVAVVSMMLLLGWQQLILLRPLKQYKADMEHMDPSEILATPFDLKYVTPFTMVPVVVTMIYWLVRFPNKFSSKLMNLVKMSLATYALFALCGNNMVVHWRHSIYSAIYIATLVNSTSKDVATSNILEQLPFDYSDVLMASRLYGILALIIPFQVLSVLDHGAQISRWPLPILFGGTYGYVVGTAVGLFANYMKNMRDPKRGKV